MTEPRDIYSPERRTALLITGTGADGAYHAGALRALPEAGVKLDIVGGRGIGAFGAVLAAVDGGAQLWEAGGFWRGPQVAELYRWRWPLRLLRLLGAAFVVVFLAPLLVVALVAIVYPVALVLGMSGLDAGAQAMQSFLGGLAAAFAPGALPTWIPRAIAVLSGSALLVLAIGALLAEWQAPFRRRSAGAYGWALVGSPIDAGVAVGRAIDGLWRLLKGGAALKTPEPQDLSRRYAELLTESIGQPGFRELLIVVHDLDAQRDMVFGLVREPYRKMLFPPLGAVSNRRAEAHDLSTGTQAFTADVVAAAVVDVVEVQQRKPPRVRALAREVLREVHALEARR
ncbi:MAG: hypothetical protein ABI665_28370, partial [Vicinamibacterales bacterium]